MDFIRCTLRPGVFSGEWAVQLQSQEGPVSFFADRSLAQPSETPSNGEPVTGKLRVSVLRREPEKALIRLPAPSSSSTTSSVWVHSDLLVSDSP